MIIIRLRSGFNRDHGKLFIHLDSLSYCKVINKFQMYLVKFFKSPLTCNKLSNIISLVFKPQVIDENDKQKVL